MKKIKHKNNFTKLTLNRGISLIVLIITIIVVIILAASVIFTISNNNTFLDEEEKTFQSENVRDEWKDKIADEVDGVPVPKGFTYKEGTKDTGLVIQDKKGNEFVWVPATYDTYVKDMNFPYEDYLPTGDDTLPSGITDETLDVIKYGGFYIGRYEAGKPKEYVKKSYSNKIGIPVSKKGATVWININYDNAKASAEQMIDNNDYVQTGLITGRSWDTTCHWIEDSLSNINISASLTNSRYYGNYCDSLEPANENSGTIIRTAGFNENWKTKNIYDLAGNVWEMTSEIYRTQCICRGGSSNCGATCFPVSFRGTDSLITSHYFSSGFRVRLYIK